MDISQIVGLVALIGAGVAALLATRYGGTDKPPQVNAALLEAQNSDSIVEKYLVRLASPIAGAPQMAQLSTSPLYAKIQTRLLAAGRPYGASVEVFLAVQVASMLLGAVGLSLAIFMAEQTFPAIGMAILSAVLCVYPWMSTSDKAKKRAAKVDAGLPDFVELLLIRIAGGQSLRVAMRRTAEMSEGPVAAEVGNLLRILDSQALSDSEAYDLAADALGTPNARAFCNALAQGDLEGAKMTQALTSLAATLRTGEYQRQRRENGKLPTKLVFIMAIHLLPLMFIVVLAPTLMSFKALG